MFQVVSAGQMEMETITKREGGRERDINRFEAEELLPLYISLPMLLCFEMCATEKY